MPIENIPQIFIKDAEKSPDLFVYDFCERCSVWELKF